MSFLDDSQLNTLRIERMVFHLVGGSGDPVFLREVGTSTVGNFFLDRIRSGNNGLMYDFAEGSRTARALSRILISDDRFNRESRTLARQFHMRHRGSMSHGLFMLFRLSCGGQPLFAVVKYDQQEVVRFAIREDTLGRKRVSLRALENALVKNPEALQKTAIIRLNGVGGELCVRDRSAGGSITRYFQRFLGAIRRHTNADLTKALQSVTREVAHECAADLSPEIKRNMVQRIDNALRSGRIFNPEDPEEFIASVFGPLPDHSGVWGAFDRSLRRHRIESETFPVDATGIRRPSKRRLTTVEGISVVFDAEYEDRVRVSEGRGGAQTITIHTGGLTENDLAE